MQNGRTTSSLAAHPVVFLLTLMTNWDPDPMPYSASDLGRIGLDLVATDHQLLLVHPMWPQITELRVSSP